MAAFGVVTACCRLSAVSRSSRTTYRALLTALVPIAFLAVPGALAAQKTDTLSLTNGDRIIGEVVGLANGLLEYKTDNVGTIKVKWDRVSRLTSHWYYEVESRSRRRYYGSFAPVDSAGYLGVALERVDRIRLADVVAITRIKTSSPFNRIDGYFDFGFTYAKSNQTLQLTSALEATYLLEEWGLSFKGDIFLQDQEGDDAEGPTRRWSVQPRVQRELSGTWLLYALAQLQQNRELNLQLRTMLSPGAGYNLFRTNAHQAIAFVGLAAQNEQYTDSTTASGERDLDSFAASLGGQYRAYRYDTPELDLTLGFLAYPSLSEWGRVRTEGDLHARYEAIKSLFLTLGFRLSTDSRPPSEDTPESDFTTTLSLSWKF